MKFFPQKNQLKRKGGSKEEAAKKVKSKNKKKEILSNSRKLYWRLSYVSAACFRRVLFIKI